MKSKKVFSRKVLANIIKIRNQKRKTQVEVASVLGIDMSTYSKIESGNITLSLDRLAEIASCLETDIIEVMFGENKYVKCDSVTAREKSDHQPKVTLQIELNEAKKEKILEMIFEGKELKNIKNVNN